MLADEQNNLLFFYTSQCSSIESLLKWFNTHFTRPTTKYNFFCTIRHGNLIFKTVKQNFTIATCATDVRQLLMTLKPCDTNDARSFESNLFNKRI